jgi:hypothetical protein
MECQNNTLIRVLNSHPSTTQLYYRKQSFLQVIGGVDSTLIDWSLHRYGKMPDLRALTSVRAFFVSLASELPLTSNG